ncbi:MAG: response regulator transcription factor [Saprospiraceae bacterium]|nr:response regulator transcription factor [Saprospiraceae bacterium]
MKAIIVEDNPGAVNVLTSYISQYGGDITLCGVAGSLEEAGQLIRKEMPNLWLLDIQLHDKLIFSLFPELPMDAVDNAAIIFITAYNQGHYIHEALRARAVEFIVKPIDRDELFSAFDKAKQQLGRLDVSSRLTQLEQRISQIEPVQLIQRLPIHRASMGDIDFVSRQEVMYFSLDTNNIVRIYLTGNRDVRTTRPLKYYEDLLQGDTNFMKVNRKDIISLAHLNSFNVRTSEATLINGHIISVSRRQAKLLKEISSRI